MSKIYTKGGDKGLTSLYDGSRHPKSSPVFGLLGGLDELGSHIGLLIAYYPKKIGIDRLNQVPYLRRIQDILLDIGSQIATPNKTDSNISVDDVKEIENWIDRLETVNKPLTKFVLSGVNKADAQAHVCRSVTRRVERDFFFVSEKSLRDFESDRRSEKSRNCTESDPRSTMSHINMNQDLFKYLNRLSDYFFVLSRYLSGCSEQERGDSKTDNIYTE
jgi:cob(I)alamin adenosyltransferase